MDKNKTLYVKNFCETANGCAKCEFWMGIGPEVHPIVYPGEGCGIEALMEYENMNLSKAKKEFRKRMRQKQ